MFLIGSYKCKYEIGRSHFSRYYVENTRRKLLTWQETIRNCKERNAKDRAERRESRFRSATPEEIGHFSWRVAIKMGPDPGPYLLRVTHDPIISPGVK